MNSGPSRRAVLLGGAAAFAVAAAPALALTSAGAKALVNRVVDDINAIIASGQSLPKMIASFERIFATYANVPAIGQQVLGPPARSLSAAQSRRYSAAFQGYMARKYGRRFREFIGGKIEVKNAKSTKSYFEVFTTAFMPGRSPFPVTFRVASFGGKELFFDMLIDGISLIKSERVEMTALLEQRRGNLDRLISDLAKLG